MKEAKKSDKPTLICCKTEIGKGSPNKAGSADAHGAALGDDEIVLTKENINWPHEPFFIPEDIYNDWDHKSIGQNIEDQWLEKLNEYTKNHASEAE